MNQQNNPEEVAYLLYSTYLPIFKAKIKNLSSRARARVLNALVEYPLNEKDYVHTSKDEKEAMAIGHSVLEAKFILIMSQYNNGLQEIVEAADPNVEVNLTEEEKTSILQSMENNKGELNG